MGGTKVKVVEDTPAEEPQEQAQHKEKAKKGETAEPRVKKSVTSRKLPRHGKKYREAVKLLEPDKLYPLAEAVELVKKTSTSSFDGSVDIHLRLNVDLEKSEQSVRGTLTLPKGSGKSTRVAVIAEAEKLTEASQADVKGGEELIAEIEKGQVNFEILIATPAMMPKLAKLGKVLGPKGLMPNPKTGTVTDKIQSAIAEFKGGKQEFRMDKTGIVHSAVGKVSFSPEDLSANVKAFIEAVRGAKPDSVKGSFIASVTVAPTMGPSIKIDIQSI